MFQGDIQRSRGILCKNQTLKDVKIKIKQKFLNDTTFRRNSFKRKQNKQLSTIFFCPLVLPLKRLQTILDSLNEYLLGIDHMGPILGSKDSVHRWILIGAFSSERQWVDELWPRFSGGEYREIARGASIWVWSGKVRRREGGKGARWDRVLVRGKERK